MMNDIVEKIKRKVVKENPEFKDVEPIVEEDVLEIPEEIEKKMGKEIPKQKKIEKQKIKTITFKRFGIAEDGTKIPIVLSITVDEKGNILKETGN